MKHGAEGFSCVDNSNDDRLDTTGDRCCKDGTDVIPGPRSVGGGTAPVAMICWLSLLD